MIATTSEAKMPTRLGPQPCGPSRASAGIMVNGESLVTITKVLVYLSPDIAGTAGGSHPQKSPARHEI